MTADTRSAYGDRVSTDVRIDPPQTGSEVDVLLGFLGYHRDTMRMKTAGLSDEQLGTALSPSSMTLGGMIKHLAFVESYWFREVFLGVDAMAPFDAAPWPDDNDWDWHSAAEDRGDVVRMLWEQAVVESQSITAAALARPDGIEQLSSRSRHDGDTPFNLRWILVHMIEEYCRHNGHADLLREAIDGQTGE
jgi:uncharacterized damage-inducible protein DinB